jgi:membrane associated rhomboid family serine protease
VIDPLSDKDPAGQSMVPVATYALIALNVAVFLVEGFSADIDAALVRHLALVPAALWVAAEGPVLTALTFVTYSVLHGSWVHLIGNMLFLWVFGGNVEDAMGHLRFIAFYVLCAAAGGAAYVLSAPTSLAPLAGASGAVAGIVAAYLMLRPCARIEVFVFVVPVAMAAYWALGSWIILQVAMILEHVDDGIAWWTHLGGLAAGALLITVMRRRNVRLFDCGHEPARAG